MPDPVLTLLKYVFLAVLYLFFMRVLRAVWVETRQPRPAPAGPDIAVAPGAGPAPGSGARAGGPETLVVVAPETMQGREFPVSNETTVGRGGGCGILLSDDSFVSQLHARVFRRDGEIWVEDLGSTNGTFLNGNKVTSPVTLRKGDRVQFGRTTMEVRK